MKRGSDYGEYCRSFEDESRGEITVEEGIEYGYERTKEYESADEE
jgi:hypothetical protein